MRPADITHVDVRMIFFNGSTRTDIVEERFFNLNDPVIAEAHVAMLALQPHVSIRTVQHLTLHKPSSRLPCAFCKFRRKPINLAIDAGVLPGHPL